MGRRLEVSRQTHRPRLWEAAVVGMLPLAACRCLIALLALACAGQIEVRAAATEPRVAVVIGNAAYPAAPLHNTVNDAKAVAQALREVGFNVIEIHDGTRTRMQDAIDRAAAQLRGRNGVGLLYFAGHGVQLDWHNYLLPVDSQLSTAAEVRSTALSLQSVIDVFRIAGNRVSLVVIDACRDNPFIDASQGKGLAQMDAPPGTLLAFATAPGRVAEDGNPIDGNGLYTHHLVSEMRRSASKVEDVFKRVRVQVRKQSEGRQIPWESTSLEDDFYFDPTVRVTTLAEGERAREMSAQLVRERAEWARIRRSTNPDDFSSFLARQTTGEFAEAAELRAQELRQLIRRAKPGQPIELPDPRNRYATGDSFSYVSLDGYTQLASNSTWLVRFADNDRVEFSNGLVWTQQGALIRDSRGYVYDPPRQDLVAALEAGKAWHSEYKTWRGQSPVSNGRSDYKVTAVEPVVVPAGTFQTYRIEISGEAGLGTFKGTSWVDAETMHLIRLDVMTRIGGRIDQYFSLRLASVKRAPRWADP